jgi:hypothetical protein
VSGIPACAQIMTGMVQGMALLCNPNADITTLWQTTLLIFLFLLLAFGFNIFLFKYMPAVESTMVRPRGCHHSGIITDRVADDLPCPWLFCIFDPVMGASGSSTSEASVHRVLVSKHR